MKYIITRIAALLLVTLAELHAADHATFVNEDAWHYFVAAPEVKRGKSDEAVEVMRPEFTLTKEGLENYIDEIARGHVTHFLMNLNTQRANFPSKTLEPLWKSLHEAERDHLDYIRAMKALYENGVDPYKVWIDRCRVKGVHPWISIRMNDLHRTDDPKSPNISTFWHEHPEYRLRPKGWDNGLNFALEPVRKRMLDFITEVLERYDPDGLELDLIRFPFYLPQGREKECSSMFTAYMREIREVANAAAAKRGHMITLSVRLLPKPSESRNLGMEADVWAKAGIVDLIVPCNHWASIDFDIPLAEWRNWTGDKVPIIPGADSGITENGKRRLASFAEYRRWADCMHERGAKSLYFFNLFMHPQDGPVWNGVLSGGLAQMKAVQGAAAASLQPPQHLGPPRADQAVTNRAFTGIPSMAVAPKGRLWAAWYAGVTPAEDLNNYVALSTSGDNGTTWTEALAVDPDAGGPVRSFDPELWVSPDGKLFFFWAQMEKGRRDSQLGVWCIETSEPDSAQSKWSKPRRIGDGVMMCKPFVLSSGEWVLPVSKWKEHDNSAQMIVSNDRGKTWFLRGACNVPKDVRQFDEHMFVERKDGSIWLLVRTTYGIGESVSMDGGKTWPELKPSGILHTPSRFFISRLASGNLLLVKHGPLGTRTSRSHLTAYISTDDGHTWTGGLMLDERLGVSYPDGQQTPDGLIRIIYDYNRVSDRNILMAAFREEDVAAGKDLSGAVKLRQLVSKATGGEEKPKPSSEPVHPNADGKPMRTNRSGALTCENVTPQALVPGAKLFTDRAYLTAEIPAALKQAHFLPITMNGQKTIKCERAGTVFFLTPALERNRDTAAQALMDQGFEKVALAEVPLFNPASPTNFCTLFQKDCTAGEILLIGKWALPVFFP